jgi:hypothetical protein
MSIVCPPVHEAVSAVTPTLGPTVGDNRVISVIRSCRRSGFVSAELAAVLAVLGYALRELLDTRE